MNEHYEKQKTIHAITNKIYSSFHLYL